MRPQTAQNLLPLFRSAARLTSQRSKTSSAAAKKKPHSHSSAGDAALKGNVSSISSSFSSISPGSRDGDDESAKQLSADASNMFCGEIDLNWEDESVKQAVWDMGRLLSASEVSNLSLQRKAVSRERKQKWDFKSSQTSRFDRLVSMCSKKLGPGVAIEVFGKLGKETGLKEYNAVLKEYVQTARDTKDEDVSLEQIYKAYQILKLVKEKGFRIEEETYGQLLMFLIDFGMEEEFFFFCELIKDDNPDSLPRLAYYEMLLLAKSQ